jgi:hypothetical protein
MTLARHVPGNARQARTWRLAAAALALLLAGTARAGDPLEFWPELNLFETLGPTSRLYFVAAYGKGKESPLQTFDLAAYYDFTLMPFLRHALRDEDWQRNKYLWARIGYDHVFKFESETGARTAPEDRGIAALYGRAYLPAEVLFEGRVRVDLRWIEGDYSTRYRLRGELNRQFDVGGHPVTAFIQAEAFYDTRYDGWARELYQVGAEVGITPHFRFEPSLARQLDHLPEPAGLWAFALVARWYY